MTDNIRTYKINLTKVARAMIKANGGSVERDDDGYISDDNEWGDGWTNTLMDILEDKADLETAVMGEIKRLTEEEN